MSDTYLNPVLKRSAPDPFVFKHRGEYWCISSHCEPRQRKFEMLRSPDLVHWQVMGGALEPLVEEHPHYWAPEITYLNGVFYLYYSVGNETFMQLRVATSRNPGGPYIDKGLRLTKEDFAIDAHVFLDEDGSMYMFYATDFLEFERIGTGTVVDRMIDPFTLAGEPHPVSRAAYEWQVFDPARVSKGGVKWHTIEGSFVLKRKGTYYQMFSGGNWTNQTYGVGYATSNRILCEDEWTQPCDGLDRPLVIRTLPGLVAGPGHNSIVRGPDNRQLYCAYHRWVGDARMLSIDPLDWAGDRLLVLGPSHTPQPLPVDPTIRGFDAPEPWSALLSGGGWELARNEARQKSARRRGEARWELPAPQFTLEVTVRADGAASTAPGRGGSYGVLLIGERNRSAQFGIRPADGVLHAVTRGADRSYPLPRDFDPAADHLFRLEVDGNRVTIMLDNLASRWRLKLPFEPFDAGLFTDGLAATFSAPEITLGWEELFYGPETSPNDLDWEGDRDWFIQDAELRSPAKPRETAMIAKLVPAEEYELVINTRVLDAEIGGGYGLCPALSAERNGPLIALERTDSGWQLVAGDDESGSHSVWLLPDGFDAMRWQQWRIRVTHSTVSVTLEGQQLGQLLKAQPGTHVGLAASRAHAAFDMVRVTALPQ